MRNRLRIVFFSQPRVDPDALREIVIEVFGYAFSNRGARRLTQNSHDVVTAFRLFRFRRCSRAVHRTRERPVLFGNNVFPDEKLLQRVHKLILVSLLDGGKLFFSLVFQFQWRSPFDQAILAEWVKIRQRRGEAMQRVDFDGIGNESIVTS